MTRALVVFMFVWKFFDWKILPAAAHWLSSFNFKAWEKARLAAVAQQLAMFVCINEWYLSNRDCCTSCWHSSRGCAAATRTLWSAFNTFQLLRRSHRATQNELETTLLKKLLIVSLVGGDLKTRFFQMHRFLDNNNNLHRSHNQNCEEGSI